MASQQVLFAETVASIKKALKRKAYESDSDDSIDHNGNRGQKLKKRARFARRGQLAPATPSQVYKEEIEYAGVRRRIVARNPPLVDDEGFEVDSDDDEERIQEALSNIADLNPYADLHLEQIIAPLTAVTDLPNHPTLSTPFTSTTLAELSNQASELMRREQESLWKVRKLMTGLCGDYTWIPCGPLVGPNDIELFADDRTPQERRKTRPSLIDPGNASSPMTNGDKNTSVNGAATAAADAPANSTTGKAPSGDDVPMADASGDSREDKGDGGQPSDGTGKEQSSTQPDPDNSQKNPSLDKKPETGAPATAEKTKTGQPGDTDKALSTDEGGADGAAPNSAGGTVPSQAADRAGTSNAGPTEQGANGELRPAAPTADSGDEICIHPFFTPPANPLPDRDMGLPEKEAENVRHLMSLYIQKQEEICRGATKLYQGLMKADRLRATVLRWATAEAHVGEMSDGEDWYDKDEWGLSDDLGKGQDEEEEDTTQTAKKTRNRRQ
ncbi:uncharacterized protein DNG_07576 [Cephalotrichum gorgonifer]|uniref:Transcriptional regulatory protein RXT2 N-terminal domain-containing protein n=1 Tax=Cephalotrichum gorgonifer TaxID=2041049 RepID=A0AAE8SXJ1_9PEZI|nr:uncharacterized protein DNG_07576 [Cephalotrichum gorgonifer]